MQPAQVVARQALFTQWATPLYHRSSAVKLAFRRVQNLLIHKKHNISTTFQTQLSEVPKSPLLHDERRATMYELYQKRKDVGSHYPRTRSLSLVRQHFSIFLAKLIEASLNSIAALHSRSAQSAKPFSQRVDTVHALNLSALPSVDRVHAPSCALLQTECGQGPRTQLLAPVCRVWTGSTHPAVYCRSHPPWLEAFTVGREPVGAQSA